MVYKVALQQIFPRVRQFSTVSIMLFLPEKQTGKAEKRSKSNGLLEIRDHWIEMYTRKCTAPFQER
jgi:hypothetical protein